jgi:glycogen synthase
MQLRGMHADVSWRKSAGRYAALYRALAGAAGA